MNNNDLRSIKTEKNLKEALIDLLSHDEFKNISTKAIYQQALVGKSTFYKHYVDKYDLLAKIVDANTNHFQQLLSKRMDHWEYEQLLLNLYHDLNQNRDEILILYNINVDGISLRNNWVQLLMKYAEPLLNQYQFPVPDEFIKEIYASVALESIIWSLKNGNGDKIAPFTNNIIADIIQRYNN